jgi:hypothetical protein
VWVDGDYVPEHRLVMEQHLGRPLEPDEIVHHSDHDKLNNDISNLVLVTRNTHMEHHPQKPAGRWSREHDACVSCGRTDVPHNAKGRCRSCYSNERRWGLVGHHRL